MTSKATSTKGLKLQRGDGATSEAFTTIGEVTNIKGPSEKVDSLEVTSFDSTGKEYISGLTDAGEHRVDAAHRRRVVQVLPDEPGRHERADQAREDLDVEDPVAHEGRGKQLAQLR